MKEKETAVKKERTKKRGKEQEAALTKCEGAVGDGLLEKDVPLAADGTQVCDCKMKHRDDKEYRDLYNRLRRVEGQIRGVQKMVEEDRYCVDILIQVMAIQSALNSFNKILLSNHIKSCVVEDIKEGNEKAVDELCATIRKLMK